ncbi:hypothetical protein VN97_g11661 [Penicillium thymicola]|uniref:Uncharacterized protein n=1 Tax=Penicillium thymicola TaxID=293382 RepID=A0AAI9X366_PENTH|nr:hypothetical protein VN97_g11661 [Penicillium thymicola]
MKIYYSRGKDEVIYKTRSDQLGCLYRPFGANSDGAACFLICTSLISQQSQLSRECRRSHTRCVPRLKSLSTATSAAGMAG